MPEEHPPLAQGRYRLLGPLGQGGMASVFWAFDQMLEVERAVKVLDGRLTSRSVMKERFLTEARTMARLKHKNIVSVQDVGVEDGRPFIVMELLPGGSLADRLERGPLPPQMALGVISGLLAALEAAHAAGVVHRDIKPGNVLLDADGTPKVADFGIARVSDTNRGLTRTGVAMGTPAFMAPEQRDSAHDVDHRADLYAVAGTLYKALSGREPYDLYNITLADELFRGIPDVVGDIIRKGARYAAADRYPDAAAMRRAVLEAMEALPEDPPGACSLVRVVEWTPFSPERAITESTFDGSSLDESGGVRVPDLGTLAGDEALQEPEEASDSPSTRRVWPWLLGVALFGVLVVGAVSIIGTGWMLKLRSSSEPSSESTSEIASAAVPEVDAWAEVRHRLTEGDVEGLRAQRPAMTAALEGLRSSGAAVDAELATTAGPFEQKLRAAAVLATSDPAMADEVLSDVPAEVTSLFHEGRRLQSEAAQLEALVKSVDQMLAASAAPISSPAVDTVPREVRKAVSAVPASTDGSAAVLERPPPAAAAGVDLSVEPEDAPTVSAVVPKRALLLSSSPMGAVVLIDGVEIGKTPILGHEVAEGDHTLRMVLGDRSGERAIFVGRRAATRYVWSAGEDSWQSGY